VIALNRPDPCFDGASSASPPGPGVVQARSERDHGSSH
jgi:hypothetical protein